MNKNWCTSRELAKEFGKTNEYMKDIIDVLRGKSASVFFHCHKVKRVTGGQGVIVEYVLDFPLDIITPMVKQEIEIRKGEG